MDNRIYDIIKKQVLTEKSNRLQEKNKLVFRVDRTSNAIEIKAAVEKLFSVKVSHVNTINVKSKKVGVRRSRSGKHNPYKKAILTLADGYSVSDLKI
jgi:large subunit ribosomal protein L23